MNVISSGYITFGRRKVLTIVAMFGNGRKIHSLIDSNVYKRILNDVLVLIGH